MWLWQLIKKMYLLFCQYDLKSITFHQHALNVFKHSYFTYFKLTLCLFKFTVVSQSDQNFKNKWEFEMSDKESKCFIYSFKSHCSSETSWAYRWSQIKLCHLMTELHKCHWTVFQLIYHWLTEERKSSHFKCIEELAKLCQEELNMLKLILNQSENLKVSINKLEI